MKPWTCSLAFLGVVLTRRDGTGAYRHCKDWLGLVGKVGSKAKGCACPHHTYR